MRLAILWHFHQPIYKKPGGTDFVLPWVNLHTTKNYWPMGRLAEECGWPCTYNFVPCLLEQMEDYASGRARDPFQEAMEKDPARLRPEDMARLRFLVPEAGDIPSLPMAALQSFFSPVDEPLPRDREGLLEKQKAVRRAVLPLFKRLAEAGLAELTVSAYYHPLLPLLADLSTAGPESPPGVAFRYPEDAAIQLLRGRRLFTEIFGRQPSGLWPSEGAVSRAAARMAAEAGFVFAVSDENVLWKSLGRPRNLRELCRPWECEGLTFFFRDRELSDLIGFEYARWDEKEAVSDLLRRIDVIRREAGDEAILTLALDGENPWAAYRDNGQSFLRRLYGALASAPGLAPAFFGDAARMAKAEPLDLVPGTWMGSFAKWAGSPAKNDGWAALAGVREAYGPSDPLYVAEGSDWFWWFGEEPHPAFSQLFRLYLEEARRPRGDRP